MKNHVKVYMDHFALSKGEIIYSEISGLPATDCHHLDPRGRGGSKEKDYIENLMFLTRQEHDMIENNPKLKEFFIKVHEKWLICNPYLFPEQNFNEQWLDNLVELTRLMKK